MADKFQALRWLLQDPSGNTAAAGLAVAIVVLAVIVVALALIAFALPTRRAVRAMQPDAPETENDTGTGTGTDELVLGPRRSPTRTPGWVVALVVATIVVAGALGGSLVWYRSTSSEEYCTRMCHAMAEPSETWATSAHAGTSCVRCHEGRSWFSFGRAVRLRSYSLYLQLSGARPRRIPVPATTCFECHRKLLDRQMTARNGEPFTHREVLAERPECIACHGQQGHEPPRPKPSGTSPK